MTLRTSRIVLLLLALGVGMAFGPLAASANSRDVIRDCAQDGDLDGEYSDEELAQAERDLPSDIDEYSDCRDVIHQAQAGGEGDADDSGGTSAPDDAGSGGGSGTSGGADPAGSFGGEQSPDGSPLDADGATGGVAGSAESSADGELASGSSSSDDGGLSTAAVVALILLALAALAAALYFVRDRLPSSLSSRFPD